MGFLRAFFQQHRGFAIAVILAALCVKALVPAGMMVAGSTSLITVEICADASGTAAPLHVALPMKSEPVGKAASHADCAFSSLGMMALGAVDVALLAAALAFILATGFAAVRTIRPHRLAHLRPPLRGPPACA